MVKVFDCPKLIVNHDSWTCTWCGESFKFQGNLPSATRGLAHVLNLRRLYPDQKSPVGVKGCSAHARIDLRYRHRYQDLLGKQQRRRSGNLEAKQHTTKRIRAENNDGATTYSVTHHPKKKRNSPISSLSSPPLADGTDQSVCPPEDSNVLSEITQEVIPAVTHSLPSPTDAKPPPIQTSIANYVTCQPTAKTTKQQVLGPNLDVFLPSAEEKLNFAIANMIHSEALPFKFSESPHLAEVIKLAKHVPYTYKPISRKSCSGCYL